MPATLEHTTITHRLFDEIFNQGRVAIAEEIYASHLVNHDPHHPDIHTLADVKRFVQTYRTAFPDLHITIQDMITQDDKVVIRWSAHGTHAGTLINLPPTGRQITITGMNILRITNGKIQEEWANWDIFSLMQQLGIIPSMD